MKNRLHRALRLAKNTCHSYDSVADAALHESMQRLPWVVASAVIALCIGAVVNWGAEGARTPPALLGLHLASGIDLVLAVWAVTAALIPRLFRSCGRMQQFLLLFLCAGVGIPVPTRPTHRAFQPPPVRPTCRLGTATCRAKRRKLELDHVRSGFVQAN